MAYVDQLGKNIIKIILDLFLAVLLVYGKKSLFVNQTKKKNPSLFYCLFCDIKMDFDYFLGHNQPTEVMPEFLAPLDNLTVTQGRDVSFTCVANDLGAYRVRY